MLDYQSGLTIAGRGFRFTSGKVKKKKKSRRAGKCHDKVKIFTTSSMVCKWVYKKMVAGTTYPISLEARKETFTIFFIKTFHNANMVGKTMDINNSHNL